MTGFIAKSATHATVAMRAAARAVRRLGRLPEALAELIEKHALGD